MSGFFSLVLRTRMIFLIKEDLALTNRDELARADVWILGKPFDAEVDLDVLRPAELADLFDDPHLGFGVNDAAPAEFKGHGRKVGHGDLLTSAHPAEELREGGRDVVAGLARYRSAVLGVVVRENEVLDLARADGLDVFLAEVGDGAADLACEIADSRGLDVVAGLVLQPFKSEGFKAQRVAQAPVAGVVAVVIRLEPQPGQVPVCLAVGFEPFEWPRPNATQKPSVACCCGCSRQKHPRRFSSFTSLPPQREHVCRV